jgi:hypothetical protein
MYKYRFENGRTLQSHRGHLENNLQTNAKK